MEDTENTQTQFTDLPDDVQRRILLDAYTNDGIVTRITDTLHAQQTERIYYNAAQRERDFYRDVISNADPTNVHFNWRGFEMLQNGYQDRMNTHQSNIDRLEVIRRTQAGRIYYFNNIINRLSRNVPGT